MSLERSYRTTHQYLCFPAIIFPCLERPASLSIPLPSLYAMPCAVESQEHYLSLCLPRPLASNGEPKSLPFTPLLSFYSTKWIVHQHSVDLLLICDMRREARRAQNHPFHSPLPEAGNPTTLVDPCSPSSHATFPRTWRRAHHHSL